jgi:hypothetical protein
MHEIPSQTVEICGVTRTYPKSFIQWIDAIITRDSYYGKRWDSEEKHLEREKHCNELRDKLAEDKKLLESGLAQLS